MKKTSHIPNKRKIELYNIFNKDGEISDIYRTDQEKINYINTVICYRFYRYTDIIDRENNYYLRKTKLENILK